MNRLSTTIDKGSIGLHKNNANGSTIDRIRKDIIGLFIEKRLSVTNEKNLIEAKFLDVTFNFFFFFLSIYYYTYI